MVESSRGQAPAGPPQGPGPANAARPPGSLIAHMEAPILGFHALQRRLQQLVDMGLKVGDWEVVFTGTLSYPTGVIRVGKDGRQMQQQQASPAYLLTFVVGACEHGADPFACPQCQAAAAPAGPPGIPADGSPPAAPPSQETAQ